MNYVKTIENLTKIIPPELVDFSSPRDKARSPTQISSEFVTKKEQGDWAEQLLLTAINTTSKNHTAVRYGKSDDIVAGDEGFIEFYQEFQQELDTIGKRPDILIFKKEDFNKQLGYDISKINHNIIIDYVKKAVAGIEVRSSAFLIERYEASMKIKKQKFTQIAFKNKNIILSEYADLLSNPSREKYIDILNNINEKTISCIDFRVPGWSSSERLIKLNDLFKQLKIAIKEVQKRDYLSITPKVEDIKVVYKWIETFGVPHYYFQVFFDKIYGISFENILKIISEPDNEGELFSVESDPKNQNKTTIKIKSNIGKEIAAKVSEPVHKSVRKELDSGRLLYYVTFNGGSAYIDVNNLTNVLEIKGSGF